MKNQVLISILAVVAVAFVCNYATDKVGDSSGVVWNTFKSRWQSKKLGAMTTSVTDSRTSVTNVVTKVPGVIGKVMYKWNTLNDEIYIYDSLTNSFTAADVVYHAKALTDTLWGTTASASTPTLGQPIIVDLGGWSMDTAISTVMKRSLTSTLLEGWMQYDTVK